MNFQKITIEDTPNYINHLNKCMQIVSEASPTIMIIGEDRNVRAYASGYCWQRVRRNTETIWLPPLGDWDISNWQEICTANIPPGTVFKYVPEYLMNIWAVQLAEHIDFQPTPDDDDYVYYVDRQDEAQGKDYRHIRSKRNNFINNNNYTIHELTPTVFPKLLELQDKFMQASQGTAKDNEELIYDNQFFRAMLKHWEELTNVQGIYVTIDDQFGGFFVWEELDKFNSMGLFCKTDSRYSNLSVFLYTEIYRILKESGLSIFNNMSDAGLPNLRYSKQCFNPLVKLKKYSVVWNG